MIYVISMDIGQRRIEYTIAADKEVCERQAQTMRQRNVGEEKLRGG